MSEQKPETLGQRIRQVRGDMPQKEFADLLGVGRTALFNYEKDERTPDANFMVRMEVLFGVTFHWLMTGEGPESTGERLGAREAMLLWMFRHCTPEGQDALEKMAQQLVKLGGGTKA